MRTAPPRRFIAAAACLACTLASAAELGTLFNTPEERDRLDRLRRGEPPVAAASHEGSRTPQVTGFVRRSDGRDTLWIDGVPVSVGQREAARVLQQDGKAGPKGPHEVRIQRDPAKP
jgi:hypothetical protein